MKTVSVEEFQSHVDQYLGVAESDNVLLVRDGKPITWLRSVERDYGEEDRAYIDDPEFWKMIQQRRCEPGIPWEEAKQLGLDG